MMTRHLVAAATAAILLCGVANAQIAEKIDPVTGNYVPVRDAYDRDSPDPNGGNTSRVSPRMNRPIGKAAQSSFAASGGSTSSATSPPDASNAWVSMPNMELFDPNGTGSAPSSSSNTVASDYPPWWPQ